MFISCFVQGIFKKRPVLFQASSRTVGKELSCTDRDVFTKSSHISFVVKIHFVRWAREPLRLVIDVKKDNIVVAHTGFNLYIGNKRRNRGQDQIQSLKGCFASRNSDILC